VQLILLQPLVPRRHQRLGLTAAGVDQVEHAPRPATAGAALGVTADGTLLIQEAQGLLQHRFREAQAGMSPAEVVHQCGGIAVGLQQPFQDPAHRQLQAQVLDRRLLKEGADRLKAGLRRQGMGSHRSRGAAVLTIC